MGFTFSHPALIIPFKYLPREIYSVTGLVIGSMVPDIEYFMRLDNASKYSHTLLGLFWFDIPMAILLSVFYHLFIRNALISNLPRFLKVRFSKFQHVDWMEYLKKNWIVVIFSILGGSLTHLFWDSFTSSYGLFTGPHSFLMKRFEWLGVEMRGYTFVRYLSSLIGGIVILYQVFLLPRYTSSGMKSVKYYWPVLIVLWLFMIGLRLYIGLNDTSFDSMLKTSISSGLIALIATSLACRKLYYGSGPYANGLK